MCDIRSVAKRVRKSSRPALGRSARPRERILSGPDIKLGYGRLGRDTLAATAGRVAALRALFVTMLAGFVTKFIVLDALYDPTRSLAGRLLTTLLEGATLGGMTHVVWSPLTGYLAFGTVLIYFLALMLLPRLAETPADGDGLVVRHEIAPHDPSG